MSEKVKISKEMKDAIESLRQYGYEDSQIVARYFIRRFNEDDSIALNDLSGDQLIRALYIGYDIEATPTEQATQWCVKRNCIVPGLHSLLDERDKDKKQIEYLQSVVKADETTLERITKERDDFMNELKNVANPAWSVAVDNIKLRKEAESLRSELAGFRQR